MVCQHVIMCKWLVWVVLSLAWSSWSRWAQFLSAKGFVISATGGLVCIPLVTPPFSRKIAGSLDNLSGDGF